MKSLLDASSIFEAVREARVDELGGLSTVEIARYEIGNILWKHTSLLGDYTRSESADMMRLLTNTFNVMNVLQLHGHEGGVLELANDLNVPYYDASYIYFASRGGNTLVTEDAQMMKKGKELGLPCISIKEM